MATPPGALRTREGPIHEYRRVISRDGVVLAEWYEPGPAPEEQDEEEPAREIRQGPPPVQTLFRGNIVPRAWKWWYNFVVRYNHLASQASEAGSVLRHWQQALGRGQQYLTEWFMERPDVTDAWSKQSEAALREANARRAASARGSDEGPRGRRGRRGRGRG